jgi:hypothetical protein
VDTRPTNRLFKPDKLVLPSLILASLAVTPRFDVRAQELA